LTFIEEPVDKNRSVSKHILYQFHQRLKKRIFQVIRFRDTQLMFMQFGN